MSPSRSQRLGRVAACTALALAAGTLLAAAPATAAPAAPAPEAVQDKSKPAGPTAATAHRPAQQGAPAGRSTYAFKPAKPRLDLDGDGRTDILSRSQHGYSAANLTGDGIDTGSDYKLHGEDTETVRDVIAVGNIRGAWGTEVLQWSYDGRISMHEAYAGSTQPATWTGRGWSIYNKVVAAGDLTGDGRGDLLARTPAGDLYLYRATGSASGEPFATRVKIGPGWQAFDQIVGANDVDADGFGDLLTRTPDGNLYYYKGTGQASAPFKARTWVGGGWNAYNKVFAADDQTGDGKADLYAVTPWGKLYFYASQGNGKFAARQQTGDNWRNSELIVGSGVTPVYGKHGLYGVDTSNVLKSHVNQTNGRFWDDSYHYYKAWTPGTQLVVVAGVDKTNWALPYSWDGTSLTRFPKDLKVDGDFSNTNALVGPGDLTGDGKGDLLTRDTWGNLWLRAGNGTETGFGSPVKTGPGWNTYKTIAGGGDISGDGRADIVAVTHDGQLYAYKGTGNAAAPFGGRELVGPGWNAYSALTVAGDLNGDGRADLAARDSAGTMWLYRSQGYGGTKTFAGREWLAGGWNTYTQLN
ncbi:FG-GAP repeat domain-containing protein [Streptomyces sp. NPDC012888]|uniref:FG-GAP repeat domain-containing protein n=1 Tax=Streptomyces sp. NPDC012888 TaxID=3364855 RepID=UPI0036B69871